MKSPSAIEILSAQLEKLKISQKEHWDECEDEIQKLTASIGLLSGREVENLGKERYDDKSPTSITGTEDGI